MRTRLLLVFTVVFFSSCWGVKTKLSAEDLTWLPYEENDRLVFISSTGDLDTIDIVKKEIQFIDYRPNGIPETYKSQGGEIFYKSRKYDSLNIDKLPIIRIVKEDPETLSKFFSIHNIGFRIGIYFEDSVTELNNIVINNKKFDDVMMIRSKIELGNNHPSYLSVYPKIIYWSKSEGLVKYITYTGITWELLTKSIRDTSEKK